MSIHLETSRVSQYYLPIIEGFLSGKISALEFESSYVDVFDLDGKEGWLSAGSPLMEIIMDIRFDADEYSSLGNTGPYLIDEAELRKRTQINHEKLLKLIEKYEA